MPKHKCWVFSFKPQTPPGNPASSAASFFPFLSHMGQSDLPRRRSVGRWAEGGGGGGPICVRAGETDVFSWLAVGDMLRDRTLSDETIEPIVS
jgi:hypothetical protein